MAKSICLINGHPHDDDRHFCHALAAAYEQGAREAGHDVDVIELAKMDIPVMSDPLEFDNPPPPQIIEAQEKIKAADHLFIVYPIWMGTMPALVKAFFEQISRNDFALATNEEGGWPRKMLKGKSARVVVTMGMPSAAYKLFFGAHGVKGFESGILGMSGFHPIHDTLIGGVGGLSEEKSERHLKHMRELGANAE